MAYRRARRQPSPPEQRQNTEENASTRNFYISADTLINSISNFEDKKDQEINDFLSQFEDLARATNFNDDVKLILIKTKISGKAKEIVLNTPELYDAPNYQLFKESLKAIFQKEKSLASAQNQFQNIKQRPEQSINDFVKRFNIVSHRFLIASGQSQLPGARNLLDNLKLPRFMEAIRADIGFEVLKLAPKNFEEAVNLAKNVEIAQNSKQCEEMNSLGYKQKSNIETFINITKDKDQEIQRLTEQLNNLQMPRENPINITAASGSNSYCHICETHTHATRNCFFNGKVYAQNAAYGRQPVGRPRVPFRPDFHRSHFPQNTFRPRLHDLYQRGQRRQTPFNYYSGPRQRNTQDSGQHYAFNQREEHDFRRQLPSNTENTSPKQLTN